jgi:TonB-dependent starch-binding outer membrane protein SusC
MPGSIRLPRYWITLALGTALAAIASLPHESLAQGTGSVRGTVTDSATGRGVPGVQISVPGTPARTVTGEAGTYQLGGLSAGQKTVRAQRIGYAAMERPVSITGGGVETLNFTLPPVATVLSTVVATGYGSSLRATVSSSIASVDSSAFARIPVASIDNALQGRVAGVQVMQNSGEPGTGVSVRVRGPASINAGNQPLYVIDGVPMLQGTFEQITSTSGQRMTPISGMNPDDIATVDVLKDAAASAIYGSRGSNGVVLVTTKRGAAGNRFRFNINSYAGTQEAEKKIELLNANEYVTLLNEGRTNQGQTILFPAGTDSINTFSFRPAPTASTRTGRTRSSARRR